MAPVVAGLWNMERNGIPALRDRKSHCGSFLEVLGGLGGQPNMERVSPKQTAIHRRRSLVTSRCGSSLLNSRSQVPK